MSAGSAALFAAADGLDWQIPLSGGRGAGHGGPGGVRAIQQRLAAQPGGDVGGFADGSRGGLVIAEATEVVGVVEQAVG